MYSLNKPRKPKPIKTQAERILDKFGGARRLASTLQAIGRPRDVTAIYRWTYPKSKGGTNGTVPRIAWDDVLAAARAEGIMLTPEDLDPRPR